MSIAPWVSSTVGLNDPRLCVVVDDIISANDGDVCISLITHKVLHSKKNAYCLDIGVDVGWWTFFVHSLNPENTVHSFEPNPHSYVELVKRAAGKHGIHLHHYAVSNKIDILNFMLAGGMTHSRGVENGVPIPCRPIDEFVKDKEVDFIKIDTEGHEPYVLDNLLPYSKNIKNMIFEFTIYWYGNTNTEKINNGKNLLLKLLNHYSFMYHLSRRGLPKLAILNEKNLLNFCIECLNNNISTDIYVTNTKID